MHSAAAIFNFFAEIYKHFSFKCLLRTVFSCLLSSGTNICVFMFVLFV